MRARRALLPDAEAIRALIEEFTFDGTLLPRSLAEICENIRDFAVVESASAAGPDIIGCGALHLYGTHLAEIRSIAVRPSAQGLGAGRLLVNALFEEADLHRVDLRLPVHANSEIFRAPGIQNRGTREASGQDLQGLHELPAFAGVRRNCNVSR